MLAIFRVLLFSLLAMHLYAAEAPKSIEENYLIKSENEDSALFDHFQYNVNGTGSFILASDKKSFYSNELFTRHPLKQFDINSSKLIAKSDIDAYRHTYAMTVWNEYIVGRIKGKKIALFHSVNGAIQQLRSTKLSDHYIQNVFIKNKQRALIIDGNGTVFEVDELLDVKKRYQLKEMVDTEAICYDNEKDIIYYATTSNTIKAFDLTKNKVLFTSRVLVPKEDEYAKIYQLMLDQSKTSLIGGFDNKLALFDLKTQKMHFIGKHFAQVHALDISPDFKTIISTGLSGGLKVWDYATLKLKKELQVEAYGLKQSLHSSIGTVKFLDEDHFLYGSSLEGVRMAALSTNSMIRDYSAKKSKFWSKKISHKQLALISARGTIYYFDLDKARFSGVDDIPLAHIKRVISDRNKRLLLSENDGHFISLNMQSKHWKDQGLSFRDHFTARFALHPTKNSYARLSSNDVLQIFNIDTGKETFRLKNKLFDSSNVLAFLNENVILHSSGASAFTEDGDYASLKKAKPYLQFIDIKEHKIYHKKDHIDDVYSFDLSKDKKYLLTASADRAIKLWKLDLNNLENTHVIDTAYGEASEVYSARFNEKENKVVSFAKNGSIVLREIDLKQGRFGQVKALKGRLTDKSDQKRRTVNEVLDLYDLDIAFSGGLFYDDDKKLIVTDSFGNLNFIDAESGKILYRVLLFGQRDWLQIYPDGTYLSSKNGYKYLTRYNKGLVQVNDLEVKNTVILEDSEQK